MIGASEARTAAGPEVQGAPARIDPDFAVFHGAALGEPVLVYDVTRQPSYWTVPVVRTGRVVGFVRVSGTGEVEAVGSYCREISRLSQCPETLTRISAGEAERRAAALFEPSAGETASPPLYVYDGCPGQEAWLVEISARGRPVCRIFITAAEEYERPVDPH
ncbi:MAG TPA: hypothetical protein VFT45_07160 [Longimicrobium sp.]|nr:hypothetical protein [Longimicrobium sp.]